MTAELQLSQLQKNLKAIADQRGLTTDISEADGAVRLTVTNPQRRFSSRVAISAWTNPNSGKLNHAATLGGKDIPTNQAEGCIGRLAN